MTHVEESEKIFFMKIFLSALILNLIFQSWTNADDIRDFEIEGMSIGDSALDYFTKDQLFNDKTFYYKGDKYAGVIIFGEYEIYDDIQITFDLKKNDLKLVDIEGSLNYKNDIENCYEKQNEIANDLEKTFSNLEKISYQQAHGADKTGNSIGKAIDFEFINGDSIRVICMDWSDDLSDKNNWFDNLGVSVSTNSFLNFLTNEAYN